MARMARQWGSGTLIACGILLSSLAVAQPGVSMFADKTTGTTLRTPPPGTVIPVTCQVSGGTGVPRPLDCKTVSFTVLLNHSLATGLQFFVNGDFRAGTAFNPTDVLPCIEPVTGGYDQRCGEEQVVDGLVQPDVHTGNCIPSCDYTAGNGRCACQAGTTGSCTCFRAWRFTVQPTKFADVGAGASVCFNATSRVLGAPTEGRCVYFSLMLPPLSLYAADPTTALTAINPVYSMEAVIGQELKIPVVSTDMNAHEVMTIDVEQFAVELPNFLWESETLCRATGTAYAGLSRPCPGGVWQRHLVYTPRIEEQGIRYNVYFKSMDDGLNSGAFINVTRFVRVASLDGSSCGTKFGMCPSLGHLATGLVPEPKLVVTVVQKKPIFMLGVRNKLVYEQPAGAVYGLLGTQPGSPEANSTLPPAYVNCPMAPFGIYAHKDNSIVTIKLEPARVSPVEYGLVVTQNLYYWNEAGGAQTDPNAYFTYVGVNWVPPLGSEGRNYNLCFSASDEFSSSTLCFILPVARCSYCTKTDETLKEVAERFSTHWLQIWGANDAEYARLNQASFAASGVVGWSSTDNPWNLWKNTVIRLGPVYRTRHDVRLGTLAQRFGTTVKSLLEMNPDIRDMASGAEDVIPAGQEACILPMICTASAGS